ncbi:MAG: hypothetical protein ABI995_03425, partial [Acidobacteriota bacterium]
LFDSILNREPAPLRGVCGDWPQPFLDVVAAALRKDRGTRVQSAATVLEVLKGAAKVAASPAAVVAAPKARGSGKAWGVGWAVVVAALLGILAYWRFAPVPEIHSIAVLPFQTAKAEDQDFAVGLSQTLIDEFARSAGLRVVPRAVAQTYNGSSKTPVDIGKELGVDAVVTGTVNRGSDLTSITAQIVATGSGRQLWTKRYDSGRNELFAAQSNLAADVRSAIQVQASGVQKALRPGQTPSNPNTYDFYLRGLTHTWRSNEKDTDEAIALLEQAAALDPGFEPVQAGLAMSYGNKSFYYRPNDPQWEEKGFAAVRRALAVDPDAPEAHFAQAVMLWRPSHGFPSREALAELRKALAAQPNFDEAWHYHGLIMFHVGHLLAGQRDIEEALRINPANAAARFRLAPIFVYLQRYEDALTALDRAPRETFPAQWAYQRTWALLSLNRMQEATQFVNESLKLNPEDQGGVLHAARAMLRAKAGDRTGAESDIAEAIRVGKNFGHFHHTAYSIGAIYSLLGDSEQAQEWIVKAANDGFPNYTFFETDPNLSKLREVPKFQAFLKKLRQDWEHIPGEE